MKTLLAVILGLFFMIVVISQIVDAFGWIGVLWTFLGFGLLLVGVAFWGAINPASEHEEIKNFKTRCEESGLTYRPDLSIEISPPESVMHSNCKRFLLGLSEEKSQILIRAGEEHSMQDWLINVSDVLSVELSLNNNSVYQAGPIASLAAAAAGGLAFGGAGAVVGSLTAGRMGAGKISELVLNLRMDSVDKPLIKIHFISEPVKSSAAEEKLQLAEKWINLIEVMRHRLADSRQKQHLTERPSGLILPPSVRP